MHAIEDTKRRLKGGVEVERRSAVHASNGRPWPDLLHREIGRALRSAFGGDVPCILPLASVRSHGGRMALSAFPRDALANANTVTVAAAKATKQGYLEKQPLRERPPVLSKSRRRQGAARASSRAGSKRSMRACASPCGRTMRAAISTRPCTNSRASLRSWASILSRSTTVAIPVLTPSYLMCVAGAVAPVGVAHARVSPG